MRWIIAAVLLICSCSTVTRDRAAVLAEAHGFYRLLESGTYALEGELVRGACCSTGSLDMSDKACLRAVEWLSVVISRGAWHRQAMLAGAGLADDPGVVPPVEPWRCPAEVAP